MNKEQISDALSFIDDSMLEQTNKLRMAPRAKKITRIRWTGVASAAAAVLVLVAGATSLRLFSRQSMKEAAPSMAEQNHFAMMAESATESAGTLESKVLAPIDRVADESNGFEAKPTSAGNWLQETTVSEDTSIMLGSNINLEADGFNGVANGLLDKDGFYYGNASLNYVPEQQDINYTVESIDRNNVTFTCSNNLSSTVYTGDDYELETNIDGIWYTCEPITEIGFDSILWSVDAKAERVFNYSFDYAYGELQGGKYRIVKKFYLSAPDPVNKPKELLVAVEFDIE